MKSKKEKKISQNSVGIDTCQVKEQMKTATQLKGRFIADMTFQIRTLSNAIIGFSDLLRYEELTESQREYVNEIYNAGQGVASIVDDVLEFSKIESGQLNVNNIDCPLGELFDKIDSLVRPCASEKDLEFGIFQRADLPANIRTDPERLSQCLINLTSNAIKFTKAGYVHLDVSLDPAPAAEAGDGKPFVRFDVVDSGSGIPIDKQAIIFEPFAQIKDENGAVFISSGLGLTITSRLAELLGGKVSVTSKPNEGSTFSLVIPAGVDIESEPLLEQREPLVSVSEESDSLDRRQCAGHILLAEDQPSNRTVMTLLLEAMGMRVSVAEDGIQAVQKALSEPFDLILMDIQMPKMNGFEALKTLRDKKIEIPIIALSAASPSDGDADNRMLTEFDCFLVKPVDSRKLYEAVSKYLPVVHALSTNDE